MVNGRSAQIYIHLDCVIRPAVQALLVFRSLYNWVHCYPRLQHITLTDEWGLSELVSSIPFQHALRTWHITLAGTYPKQLTVKFTGYILWAFLGNRTILITAIVMPFPFPSSKTSFVICFTSFLYYELLIFSALFQAHQSNMQM